MPTPLNSDRISAEAIDWFLKFQQSAPGRPPPPGFAEWLGRSPEHIREYLDVSCVWDLLGELEADNFATHALIESAKEKERPGPDNVVRLEDRYGNRPWPLHPQPRRPYARLAALAACALLAFGAWVGYVRWNSVTEYATGIGEQHSVTLRDGSVVFLNTDSRVEVRWSASERHIDLIRGEARFQVIRNPTRPFIVATSNAQVRVVGTVFNVRASAQSTQVAVMEGQVEVTAGAKVKSVSGPEGTSVPGGSAGSSATSSVRLAAGERAAVTSAGIEANVGPPIESVAAWPQRRLVFRDETLGAIVNEFNRYRTQPLMLDDPQLARLEISGAFDLSDPESLVAYLRTFEKVQVERPLDGSEHLSRAEPDHSQP
jgi:transmembrane sensor